MMKWGIISTAKIGVEKVIPGMLKSNLFEVSAICSRDLEAAKKAANQLGIPKYYDSYDALLSDPEIDIIYNPLPNHLHVEWTAKAIAAGKHVLCEKPLFLNPKDSELLISLKKKHQVKVGEAFMVKTHPQWIKAKEIIDSSELGEIRAYQSTFSYFNNDPGNIRNIAEFGGGALWDIGCYPVMTSRYLFGENPEAVFCSAQFDPAFHTDVLSSAILKFPSGITANFTVSTQAAPYQRVHVLGTKKEMEILIPYNSPTDRETCIRINDADILQKKTRKINLPICDQYQLQAEAFTKAIIHDTCEPVSLEDAQDHSLIITALFQSAKSGGWVSIL